MKPVRLLIVLTLCSAAFALCDGAGAARVADGDAPALLVSRQLLEAEGLRVGEIVRLSSHPSGEGAGAFRIAGTYEPTPDPMRLTSRRLEARLHLPDFLTLTSEGTDPLDAESVDAINVRLADAADARAFGRDLAARVPGLLVRPAMPDAERSNPFVVLERFHLAIAIVTVLGSAIFLLALMVMLTDERRETVGALRLIGLSVRRVLLQVFSEGLLIALAGAAFGIAFAVGTEGLFNRFFQWRYDTALVFVRITPQVAWQCVLLAVPLGIVASLTASWTLLRRDLLSLVRR